MECFAWLKTQPEGLAFVTSQGRVLVPSVLGVLVKGLRLGGIKILEGSVVPMHEGACETGSQITTPPPLLRHMVPLNDGNCHLTLPVVKGRYAREALPHAFNIGVFKYGKSNSTTIKHIYNESENFNESCDVAFNSNNWVESSINSATDWLGENGETRWSWLHTRLLDAGHK